MNRLSLSTRLVLLMFLGFVLIQTVMTLAWLADRRRATDGGLWLPLPERLAAIAALIEAEPPADRAALLAVLNDGVVRFDLSDQPPEADPNDGALAMPRLSARLAGYAEAAGGRELRAAIPADFRDVWFPRLRGYLDMERLRVSVGLTDGTWMVVQSAAANIPGRMPGGVVIGLLGAALAALAVVAVWRETRPLRSLGEQAARFGRTLHPEPLPPEGAPDLRALIASFNEMQDRIARLDRSRTDMIAAIAHDVRTPLTRLRLRLRKLPDAVQAAAERDIDDILRVSDDAVRFAAADLAALDQEVDLAALLPPLVARGGAAFHNLAGGPALLRGNADLLGRCFENLLSNAARHATTCAVTLTRDAGGMVVTVDDDGPGIAPGDRARLLLPFERGEPSRSRETGGTGLGLALAARIAERHGAAIDLGTAPLGGLRVTLRFSA